MSWSTSHRKDRLPDGWSSLRLDILRRDGWKCQLRYRGCVSAATEVDHRNRGDDHRPENLQAACARCHATKSSREGAEQRARMRALRRRPRGRHPGRLDDG
ncbi:HNH endonuclease [Gordonia sp. X0973]|uniref:HNH endonuclease n=1 Tax=Gordonia sp. X0973 TaxID=2742602 RepID=UPI000F51E7EC|nr:HNH endonuclease signature motif containing protein [Gordonia sp. X0973]QKT09216.1 HNH endonuclease [Gordonia sp. X0973]